MKALIKSLLITFIFSLAMGMLEAIVVVYLRNLFYPAGFNFPLKILPGWMLQVEILREFCTLVMLITIALIAGKNKLQTFAYFIFCFAVWDIIYYAGLKFILDWPSSFFTWDILFLIPFPWIGPVAAPLISSLTMIYLALLLLIFQNLFGSFKVNSIEWLLIYLGAVLIFISFIWDYAAMLINKKLLADVLSPGNKNLESLTLNYVPSYFNWGLFILGIITVFVSSFLIIRRYIYKHN